MSFGPKGGKCVHFPGYFCPANLVFLFFKLITSSCHSLSKYHKVHQYGIKRFFIFKEGICIPDDARALFDFGTAINDSC
jgi:hypothetical protein